MPADPPQSIGQIVLEAKIELLKALEAECESVVYESLVAGFACPQNAIVIELIKCKEQLAVVAATQTATCKFCAGPATMVDGECGLGDDRLPDRPDTREPSAAAFVQAARVKELEGLVERAEKVLDTFSRAYVISMKPFNLGEDEGAYAHLPSAWPTVGEFKAADELIHALRERG